MGFKKDVALKFVKNSELSEKVYKAASSAKKLDERLKDLSNITEQVAKGANEQSSAVDSTNSVTERLSQSINGVVKNAES